MSEKRKDSKGRVLKDGESLPVFLNLIRYAREVEFLFGEVPPLFMYTPHLCCPP